ncbi:MAG: response regulator transcription factor [Sphingobacteriia bacterium]|nr:response regulator transcription factor [Sphingobacteriia bacterium]
MIKIALVDDHIIARRGLKAIFESEKDIEVVWEASNGKELIDNLANTVSIPEIIVLDINMPILSGIDVIDKIKSEYPKISILVFSLLYSEDTIINMITKGACGYLSKTTDPEIFPEVIRQIHTSGFYLGDLVKKEFFKKYNAIKLKPGFYGKEFLTAKEVEFIKLSSSNLSYKEIAVHLNINPKTVENYRDSLFQKLDINNRAALTVFAYQSGIVNLQPKGKSKS